MAFGLIITLIFLYIVIGTGIGMCTSEDRVFAYMLFWPIIIVFLGFKQLIEIFFEK